jgi:hypothetical protein
MLQERCSKMELLIAKAVLADAVAQKDVATRYSISE